MTDRRFERPDDFLAGFQNRLKQERKRIGKSQDELGELIGISGFLIESWEAGRMGPTPFRIHQLCHIFRCSSDHLLAVAGPDD